MDREIQVRSTFQHRVRSRIDIRRAIRPRHRRGWCTLPDPLPPHSHPTLLQQHLLYHPHHPTDQHLISPPLNHHRHWHILSNGPPQSRHGPTRRRRLRAHLPHATDRLRVILPRQRHHPSLLLPIPTQRETSKRRFPLREFRLGIWCQGIDRCRMRRRDGYDGIRCKKYEEDV